jgi:hydrogenase maturation protein HypF
MGVTLNLFHPDPDFSFQDLVNSIRSEAPAIAYIEEIKMLPLLQSDTIDFSDLKIIPSCDFTGQSLSLPPDIAICDRCLEDFHNPRLSRFYHYPFLACAQCGPRFTTMRALPYDRQRSTMDEFPLCKGEDSCQTEYENPLDRRFHAQTFGCRKCGPQYFRQSVPYLDNFEEIIELILKGKTVAIKGIGGVFLVCSATSEIAIQNLRNKKKGRLYKPFAVMMPTIETAKEYCVITPAAEKELLSFRRPIVLCEKKPHSLPDSVAPGLAHVGIILPYAGIHYLLFDRLGNQPLIYTSGNVSGLPMGIDNTEIVQQLADLADGFYLHNRKIHQRCDDSVMRFVAGNPVLIRRSRGYVPEYIRLPFTPIQTSIIAVGAELNSTGAVSRGPRIFPTQHIGNTTNLETFQFLDDAISNMKNLLQINPSEIGLIARDLHPSFFSTQLATQFAQVLQFDRDDLSQVVPVQHHHAHLASLMVDHDLPLHEEIVAITVDGVGYGADGHSWGGEILVGSYAQAQRVGGLSAVPMIGGDLCAKWPYRMLLCQILPLINKNEYDSFLSKVFSENVLINNLPHGKMELTYLLTQIKEFNLSNISTIIKNTSLGRWLDAAAALLGICGQRTYRGEPAMRLEGTAWHGHPLNKCHLSLESYLDGTNIRGDRLLFDYATYLSEHQTLRSNQARICDLAASLHDEIGQLFGLQAVRIAEKYNLHKIGITGGVAYNELIINSVKKIVESAGYDLLLHRRIPPGDAGISIGQIASASARCLDNSNN